MSDWKLVLVLFFCNVSEIFGATKFLQKTNATAAVFCFIKGHILVFGFHMTFG